MRLEEEARKIGLHLCPCGNKAVRHMTGCWTCQPCIDKDAAIYGTDTIRSTCGFRERPRRGELNVEAA